MSNIREYYYVEYVAHPRRYNWEHWDTVGVTKGGQEQSTLEEAKRIVNQMWRQNCQFRMYEKVRIVKVTEETFQEQILP